MKNKFIKNTLLLVTAFIIYFLATYPTRDIFTVFSVTDVRPGTALNPLMSMCFGPYAILGITLATTLGDYLSGYPTLVLFQGFIFQYIYGYLSYIVWKHLTKNDEHRYRLDSLNKILKFCAVALVFALTSGVGVGYIVYSNFGANLIEAGSFVVLNNFDFTIIIGMPLLIALNILVHKIGSGETRRVSKNEKIILSNVLVDILILCVIIFLTYKGFEETNSDIYTIWNTIYYRAAIAINLDLLITGFYIYIQETKKY